MRDFGEFILFLALIIFLGLLCMFASYSGGYRQGQIDALTGNVVYELVEHPDGTKTWERKAAQ